MKRKINKSVLPGVEEYPDLGETYFTLSWPSWIKPEDVNTESAKLKKNIERQFKARFGYAPERIFYGPPHGSILYAGPVIDARFDAPSTTDADPLQPQLLKV